MSQPVHRRQSPTRRAASPRRSREVNTSRTKNDGASSGFSPIHVMNFIEEFHGLNFGRNDRRMPPWIAPLAGVVALLIIVLIVVNCCAGCQQQVQPEVLAVDEGVCTVDQAREAGGVAADGSTDIQTAFAAYSWDDLDSIAQEIRSSESLEAALAVAQKYNLVNSEGKLTGDIKSFDLSDGESAAVQIAGFYHDDETAGGKAGITFIMRDALSDKLAMNASGNNDGGWELSDLRGVIESEVAYKLPSDLRDKIVQVDKMTNNIGVTESVDSITLTSDDIWLFSKRELVGENGYPIESYRSVLNGEGEQYKLFSDASISDFSTSSLLVRKRQVDDTIWWTRSALPNPDAGGGYCAVLQNGSTDSFAYYADNQYGVVLGFCF